MNCRVNILVAILSIFSVHSFAQDVSTNGTFQVIQGKRGCVPLDIEIQMLTGSCGGATPCVMDFGENDGSQPGFSLTHTYTQPGTYTLTVFYGGSAQDNIQIEVFDNIAPAFDISACNGNEVFVKVTDTNYDRYVIDYNDGTIVTVPSGSFAQNRHVYAPGNHTIHVRGQHLDAVDNCSLSSQSLVIPVPLAPFSIDRVTSLPNDQLQLELTTQAHVQYRLEVAVNGSSSFQFLQNIQDQSGPLLITSLKPDANYYCFRLRAFNPCNNTFFSTAPSNTVCSTKLTATAQNGFNALSWETSAPLVAGTTILRDNTISIPVSSTSNSFNDGDVVCKTTYCYQIVTNFSGGGESYSLVKCATAFSTRTPAAIQDVTALVGSNGVTLYWRQDPSFVPAQYAILRSSSFYASDAASPYTDEGYVPEAGYCYQINYLDICDNQSEPGIEVCPIALAGALGDDNSVSLSWTEYKGWQNGVSGYVVEKYDAVGTLLQTFNAGSELSFVDDEEDLMNQVYNYVVRANANDPGLGQALSNAVTIVKEPAIYYPAAFTPNGDNLNDVFVVFGRYILTFRMKIFNRWGELMYTSNSLTEGWNGTYNGKAMPEGTYIFVADIIDFAGQTHNRSGSVLLLRK